MRCSSQRTAVLGAGCGRLGHASCWQARENDTSQFLEVDFGDARLLGGVLTQVMIFGFEWREEGGVNCIIVLSLSV